MFGRIIATTISIIAAELLLREMEARDIIKRR